MADFAAWRVRGRGCLARQLSPETVYFIDAAEGQPLLLVDDGPEPAVQGPAPKVPREFLALAETVACFRDPQRWNLLYRVVWRLVHGESHLLEDHADPDVRELRVREKAIRRDIHKMHAFVRFRTAADGTFIAWYRPSHRIVRAGVPFFVRRFGSMRWAILTPDESAYWDLEELRFGPGLPREAAPPDDQIEDLWLTYYGSIFNPARLNLPAMMAEMPVKHWHTLPEAKLIAPLAWNAAERVSEMANKQPGSAQPFVPEGGDLAVLREAAQGCEGCELHQAATQTVFGEGPPTARIVLVGEQPGDQEDRAGRPFVGPAGQLLDRALQAAGIERGEVYVTNAVKHFRFDERGKRRLHKKPGGTHISACKAWLEAELSRLRPDMVVCLGSTAAQALVGRDVRIERDRGRWMDSHWARRLLVTIHPSALLRLPEGADPDEAFRRFVADLRMLKDTD